MQGRDAVRGEYQEFAGQGKNTIPAKAPNTCGSMAAARSSITKKFHSLSKTLKRKAEVKNVLGMKTKVDKVNNHRTEVRWLCICRPCRQGGLYYLENFIE